MTHGIRIIALGIALVAVTTARADVDVSGTWHFCLAAGEGGPGVQRPIADFTQVGAHVSGTMKYAFFAGTLTCAVGFDIDSTTGAFVPGTNTEQCPLNVSVLPRPALASADRIDGEYGAEFSRRALFGLRACDPMA